MSGSYDNEHKYCYLSMDAAQEVGAIDNSSVNFDFSGRLEDLARVVAYHSEANPELAKFVTFTLIHILYNRNYIGEVELEDMIEDYDDGMLDLYEILGEN